MAQANSVPIAIRSPVTGATSTISASGARITSGDDETTLIPLWREKRRGAEPEDLSGNPGEGLNRQWYERITGRMPVGRYVAALSYATALILLGWWPWNILLILPALASRNRNRLRFSIFIASEASVRSKVFCRGSL